MSAIWGNVLFRETLGEKTDSVMQKPYRDNYKIDRYESKTLENCYMGCGIQYITKEAERECLPIVDKESGIVFTTDCILDNREELLSELLIADSSIPDGELAYRAYLAWGIDCVKKFCGLYTLAVWEEPTKTLYLANDKTASRCLYYYRNKSGIVFSTLLAPIISLRPEIRKNELYLMDFLAAPELIPSIVEEETPYADIYKLTPATIVTITEQGTSSRVYWNAKEKLPDCHCETAEEYGNYFRLLLERCVSDAIRSSGEIGIAMSSGLDSSSVGTIAADLLASKKQDLYAYTYVPGDDVDKNTKHNIYNETEDVKAIAALHPNMKNAFLCNGGKNAIDSIPEAVQTLEIPFKAFVNYPNLNEIYENASKDGCRVALTGQFGNSTISYGNIDPVFFELYQKKKLATLISYINRFAKTMKISRKKMFTEYIKYLQKMSKYSKKEKKPYQITNPFVSQNLLEKYPLAERCRQGRMDLFDDLPSTQEVYREQLCLLLGATYLGEWETKLGLKHGIIVRDPTRDSRMLSFCYHMPYEFFAYRGETKWLIRGNMKDMIPTYILENWNRHGKQNHDWMRRISRDWNKIKTEMMDVLKKGNTDDYIQSEVLLERLKDDSFSVLGQGVSDNLYFFSAYLFAVYMERFKV